ncbi:hypothetical protein CJ030_MR7G013000 [Morella rubra]|uniref:Uncharacterized protein n=1 Tax=Morella rubra TaxID=262757 RepID=A0A6A1V5W5_9ROSI|nr:hypothetical protein CJ030_MR7G013019 [Morella rubra]KAB1208143.1 hypothetical protein CJ030_MR7G013000 [Morella rubra]
MVLSDPPEKKVVGERESRNLYVDADIMKKQMMVGVPKVSHANFVKGHAFSKNNYLSGLPAMTAEADDWVGLNPVSLDGGGSSRDGLRVAFPFGRASLSSQSVVGAALDPFRLGWGLSGRCLLRVTWVTQGELTPARRRVVSESPSVVDSAMGSAGVSPILLGYVACDSSASSMVCQHGVLFGGDSMRDDLRLIEVEDPCGVSLLHACGSDEGFAEGIFSEVGLVFPVEGT